MDSRGVEVRLALVRENITTLMDEIATAVVRTEAEWRWILKMLMRIKGIMQDRWQNPVPERILESCILRAEVQVGELNRVVGMMCGLSEEEERDE